MTTGSFRTPLEKVKGKVKVLILGSYPFGAFTKSEGDRNKEEILENLRDFLREKGFKQTMLVKDWKDEESVPEASLDIHFRDKSFYYIDKWAEILVFVLSPESDNQSVTREWGHMIDANKKKCKNSAILRHESVNLHSLIKGDIKKERIFEYEFKDENSLHDLAFSACFNIAYSFL